MTRQARAELTRRRIIAAAVELFAERGYPATALGDIVERAGMTKGALYYHFDCKEALAAAIVAEGGTRLAQIFDTIRASNPPALEGIIHGTCLVVDQLRTDDLARVGTALLRMFAGFSEPATAIYTAWLHSIATDLARARDEGDVRADVDVQAVAHTLVSAIIGSGALSDATTDGADLHARVTSVFALLLPAVVTEDAQHYFSEFVAREAHRTVPR
ncbi:MULTISPECIES: ScbR family autoregulator-binding transcription factor [Mycobacteriaceae]|uniref:ScbR family autoregulator-binding transcription factor n=1 Tax=Mycobacteriaceae TaxID=1762 RepID=UPI0007FD1C49|nr:MULTISPECIES: ScbR family autoregulator-binding transcription factor [Mycobacteriaceae]MCK0174850.1 TetR/AcrR family transcriptional regulator [Mycolicibacterium sp. F2034L]OBB59217.1 TetR family transcriptional regulator [Mycobacterium sp. 852013-51886_SCH5428379]